MRQRLTRRTGPATNPRFYWSAAAIEYVPVRSVHSSARVAALKLPRIERLMPILRREIPRAGCALWTNGPLAGIIPVAAAEAACCDAGAGETRRRCPVQPA